MRPQAEGCNSSVSVMSRTASISIHSHDCQLGLLGWSRGSGRRTNATGCIPLMSCSHRLDEEPRLFKTEGGEQCESVMPQTGCASIEGLLPPGCALTSLAGAQHSKDFADICQDILSECCSNEFNGSKPENNSVCRSRSPIRLLTSGGH